MPDGDLHNKLLLQLDISGQMHKYKYLGMGIPWRLKPDQIHMHWRKVWQGLLDVYCNLNITLEEIQLLPWRIEQVQARWMRRSSA